MGNSLHHVSQEVLAINQAPVIDAATPLFENIIFDDTAEVKVSGVKIPFSLNVPLMDENHNTQTGITLTVSISTTFPKQLLFRYHEDHLCAGTTTNGNELHAILSSVDNSKPEWAAFREALRTYTEAYNKKFQE